MPANRWESSRRGSPTDGHSGCNAAAMRTLTPAVVVCLLTVAQQAPPTANPYGVVSGVVLDDAGVQIDGATLRLRAGPRLEQIVTNAPARFRLSGVPYGTYRLEAEAKGFLTRFGEVIVGAKPSNAIAFKLARDSGSIVSGFVEDPAGTVLPGATATLRGEDASKRMTVTTIEGEFRFERVAPGNYQLSVELETFKTFAKPLVVGTEPRGTLRLVLEISTERPAIKWIGESARGARGLSK